MGFKFSSFAAGAAEAVVDTLKKDEEEASKVGMYGVKALKENYDKVMAENRKLEDKFLKNKEILKTFDSTATDAELFAAATNDAAMEMAVKAAEANPGNFRVADFVKIKEANASKRSFEEAMKAYTSIPEVSKSARKAEGIVVDEDTNFFAQIRKGASDRAASKAEEQTARAMGVSIEQLRAASGFKRPEIDAGAEFDFTSMQKQPSNAKEIKDKLEVAVIQAAQQFGENSPEYKAATEKIDVVKTEIAKLEDVVDKSLEARVNRLLVKKADSKDPAQIKALDTEIKGYQASIKQHNQATRATDPKEKQETYNKMKTSINDYVNTRMKEDKGFDWNKYVDFKTFTDPATDTTITSRTQKAGLGIEQQRELFAKERQLTAQALKANGYVLSDGTPRTPVAEQLMLNFNISANDLAASPSAPAPVQTNQQVNQSPLTDNAVIAPVKGKAPPQAAIDLLKANPQIADEFEKKYPGYSAKTYLGK
jgi:hypothetical protein